jgi:hypothetical protein
MNIFLFFARQDKTKTPIKNDRPNVIDQIIKAEIE